MQVDKLSQEVIKMERLYKVIRSHDGNICTSYIVAKSKQAVMKEYAQLGDILSITNISTKHYASVTRCRIQPIRYILYYRDITQALQQLYCTIKQCNHC